MCDTRPDRILNTEAGLVVAKLLPVLRESVGPYVLLRATVHFLDGYVDSLIVPTI